MLHTTNIGKYALPFFTSQQNICINVSHSCFYWFFDGFGLIRKTYAIDISMVIHPHTQSTLLVRRALWLRFCTN